MKILFTYDFGKEKMERIRNLGFELTLTKEKHIGEIGNFNSFEVIVCNKLFELMDINNFRKLKWVQLISVGVDRVPIESLKAANIRLTNCKGAYSIPIAEWTIAKLLEIYKNSRAFYQAQSKKVWDKNRVILELSNKKACILGTGNIGMEIAKRLNAFGVIVTGVNSTGRKMDYYDRCFTLKDLPMVLPEEDIVINTLPLTEKTVNLINGNFLANLKSKSVLLNVSRGQIVDESVLLKYLKLGHLLGAALDVFATEPLPSSSPLWLTDNLIITPHISYVSELSKERVFEIVFENLRRYQTGEALVNQVDCLKGY